MQRVLRPLALGNVAVALVFALPLLAWVAIHYLPRGSLQVTAPAVTAADQTLARIKAHTSVEDLRREATLLAEMRAFDRLHQEAQGHFIERLFLWLWAVLGIASVAFLANAGVLYWAHLKVPRAL
jgi:hypothetical protein